MWSAKSHLKQAIKKLKHNRMVEHSKTKAGEDIFIRIVSASKDLVAKGASHHWHDF